VYARPQRHLDLGDSAEKPHDVGVETGTNVVSPAGLIRVDDIVGAVVLLLRVY
jgi:hypothetical protein